MVDLAAAVTRARAVIADALIDRCVISGDPDGPTEQQLQPGTARLDETTDSGSASVYSGPCLLVAAGAPEAAVAPQVPIAVGTWRLLLPYTAPDVPRGAAVTMTKTSTPALLTKRIYVHKTILDSLNAVRAVDVSEEPPR